MSYHRKPVWKCQHCGHEEKSYLSVPSHQVECYKEQLSEANIQLQKYKDKVARLHNIIRGQEIELQELKAHLKSLTPGPDDEQP